MACGRCLLTLGLIILGLGVGFHYVTKLPDVPDVEEKYFGPGMPPEKEDLSIRPFKVNVPDEILKDLKHRLDNVRDLQTPLEGIQQQYGINTNLLKEILNFWKTKYNWKEREQFLNQYPQFKTNIQGLDIHYLHVKPKKVDAGVKVLPLLLLHGWPGSVREYYEMIPLLTTRQTGNNFVFELIVPSLPGYGFSQGASKTGLGATHMAVVFKNLMERIGFKKYYVGGGDWGSLITANMGRLYPDRVLGVHNTMCNVNTPLSTLKTFLFSFYPSAVVDKGFENKLYPFCNAFSFLLSESGYMHLQATKPDTVGVALGESPVGLAAYIIEKFTTWTNSEWKERLDGGLTKKYTYTQLLDNVMIYWVTGSITTSMRLYAETFTKTEFSEYKTSSVPIQVPTACMININELVYQPECMLKEIYVNLVHSSKNLDVGHFASFENPKVVALDVYDAVKKMEDYHKKKL